MVVIMLLGYWIVMSLFVFIVSFCCVCRMLFDIVCMDCVCLFSSLLSRLV